jgi:UDP-N-acetylmuramate--alanine ligase
VTLAGIRAAWDRRLVVVFQPHLFSRTKEFYQEFGRSFLNSDVFVCTDIYPAREKAIEGITGEMISNITKKYGHKNVHYIPDKNDVPQKLMELKKKGDIVVTMGAGDIWKYGEKFVELVKEEK